MSEEIKKVTNITTGAIDEKEAAPAVEPVEGAPTADSELRSLLGAYGDVDAILPKLRKLGVKSVSDLSVLDASDLTSAGMLLVQAKQLVLKMKNTEAEKVAAAAPAAMYSAANLLAILPPVSSDESLLKGLQIGGVLKIDDSTSQAALRVFFADRFGLFDVREKVRGMMEAQANKIQEPVDPMYWKVLDDITRREYGDLFNSITGFKGSYITEKRRSTFIERIREELCPTIRDGYNAVASWIDGYNTLMANPASWGAALLRGTTYGTPASACPPFDSVADASATVKDAINKVFRGTYLPVAAAMAKDAMDIGALLNNSNLPALLGCETKEIMLKELGLNITASTTRSEKYFIQFAIGLVKYDTEALGNELNYIQALYNVGREIPWSLLINEPSAPEHGHVVPSSIGGRKL